MIPINTNEDDKRKLPMNHIYWQANDLIERNSMREISVEKYNSKKVLAHRFYKPISRVFSLSKLLQQK